MIRMRTLGCVELVREDGSPVGSVLAQPKRLALLAYLAIASPGRFHRRDTLVALFWPELDESHARAALSQALYYLRRSLGPGVVIGRGEEEVGVDPDHLWCDTAALDAALDETDPVVLAEALELHRGELLPGFHVSGARGFERWLDEERFRLSRRSSASAWLVSERREREGRTAEAIRWARRAIELFGPDERQVRRLIELLDRVGDRAGALAAYEEMAEWLAREYAVEPSPETRRLVEAVKARLDPGPVPSPKLNTPASRVVRSSHKPVEAEDSPAESGRSGGRGVAAAGVVLVAIAAGVLLSPGDLNFSGSELAPDALPAAPARIAVLPFRTLSGDPADAHIAEGLTAELISRISRLRDLGVVPHTTVTAYDRRERSASAIGRELGVGTIVEGTAQKSDDRVRMHVQLIDVVTEELIWSGRYDALVGELLDVQPRIAEEVALALRIGTQRSEGTGRPSRTAHPDAYEAYLRGRALLGRGEWSSVMEARDHFSRAIRHDSAFAEAWSARANATSQLVQNGILAGPEPWEEVRRAAVRALGLEEELPEAHTALAMVHLASDWDIDRAEGHFRRAIELDPSDVAARGRYANLLRNLGRFDEALEHLRLARSLDPADEQTLVQEATLLYLAGRLEESARLLQGHLIGVASGPAGARRGERFGVRPFWPYFTLALVRVEQGNLPEALSALATADPESARADTRALRAYIRVKTGNPDEGRRLLEKMQDDDVMGPVSDFHRAFVHVALGEHQQALGLLEEAAEERTRLMQLLKVEPKFEPIRHEPRFQTLLSRLGLTDPPRESPAGPSARLPPL